MNVDTVSIAIGETTSSNSLVLSLLVGILVPIIAAVLAGFVSWAVAKRKTRTELQSLTGTIRGEHQRLLTSARLPFYSDLSVTVAGVISAGKAVDSQDPPSFDRFETACDAFLAQIHKSMHVISEDALDVCVKRLFKTAWRRFRDSRANPTTFDDVAFRASWKTELTVLQTEFLRALQKDLGVEVLNREKVGDFIENLPY